MQRPFAELAAVLPAPGIVYEDNHLLVLNKPAGMLAQGDHSGDPSAVDWAETYLRTTYGKPGNVYVALLHRTDRPVGGLLLLAKTSKAAARMTAAFQQQQVRKTYLAVVERVPDAPEGHLRHYLAKLPGKNIMRAYDKPAFGAKLALLDYRLLAVQLGRALLAVHPLTGRQHQIRVQLARMGCTIAGDVKYGRTQFLPDQSIGLFSWRAEFLHPVSKQAMALTAPVPGDAAPWHAFAGWLGSDSAALGS